MGLKTPNTARSAKLGFDPPVKTIKNLSEPLVTGLGHPRGELKKSRTLV